MMTKCTACRDGTKLPFAIRTAFQPILDMTTGSVFAYEALVRGPNGEGAGHVLSQVTDDLLYAFDQACRVTAIREAAQLGLLDTGAKLSINFMPNAVYSPAACIRLTLETAREVGMPLDRLIFEFTENERIDQAHTRTIIDAYRTFGFQTAIDDFGAGFSGLNLLAELATDIVKLDMDLIRGIDANVPRRHIVKALLAMCIDLDRLVIAEGIETEGEAMVLRELGVRYMQGYYFAKPQLAALPAPDINLEQSPGASATGAASPVDTGTNIARAA